MYTEMRYYDCSITDISHFFFAFDIRPFIICIPLFFFSTYLEVIKVFYFQNNNGLIVSSDYKDIAYLV